MSDDAEYEIFVSVWKIKEWHYGTIYKTDFVENQWIPRSKSMDNKPSETNLIYASPMRPKGIEELRGIRKVKTND